MPASAPPGQHISREMASAPFLLILAQYLRKSHDFYKYLILFKSLLVCRSNSMPVFSSMPAPRLSLIFKPRFSVFSTKNGFFNFLCYFSLIFRPAAGQHRVWYRFIKFVGGFLPPFCTRSGNFKDPKIDPWTDKILSTPSFSRFSRDETLWEGALPE